MGFKSIKDKGGLKAHILDMGYNYSLFVLLMRAKVPDTVIANVLNMDKDKKLVRTTIKHWREIYQDERQSKRIQDEVAIDELNRL